MQSFEQKRDFLAGKAVFTSLLQGPAMGIPALRGTGLYLFSVHA